MKKIQIQMLLYTLTKKFMEVQGYMLNPFGIILYIITTVCSCVRSTTVPRFNGPAELARTVEFRDRKPARTVGFRKPRS
jgi:hypothetical protein